MIAWEHRFASTAIAGFTDPGGPANVMELGGAADVPFAIPNVRVEYRAVPSAMPRGWLRSVEHGPNAFAVQSFVGELAAATGRDAHALLVELIGPPRLIPPPLDDGGYSLPLDTARLRRVLDLAAQRAGWGSTVPAGTGRGIAAHCSRSYAAAVVDASVSESGIVKVQRVVCAVDCGFVIDPGGVEANLEGGIVFALSAALGGLITVANGEVEQGNFDRYPVLRLADTPSIEVHLTPSQDPPLGVGEAAVPPVAPALANAIFAATGRRVRRLPILPDDLR